VITAVYGVETARQMIEVLSEGDLLAVNGFISPPGLTRSNRREILFFVNQRPVQDPALTKALTQAYHTLLMKGRYPISVLFLELPADKVDVNVHPTKAEVRFEDKGEVFRGVGRAVRRALLANTPVPGAENLGGVRLWSGPALEYRDVQRQIDPAWEVAKDDGSFGASVESGQISAGMGTPILRLIGQVAATYLIGCSRKDFI